MTFYVKGADGQSRPVGLSLEAEAELARRHLGKLPMQEASPAALAELDRLVQSSLD